MKGRGYLARTPGPLLLDWFGHVTLALGGLAAVTQASSLPWQAAALFISAFGFIGIGTTGHTASHGAAFHSPFWNRVQYYISFPLLLQLSACYWRYSHIVVHHPAPNVVGIDDDCDLRPLFGLNEDHLESLAGPFRRWPAMQGLVLPLVVPLNGFNIVRQGWQYLLGVMFDSKRRNAAAWADLAFMCLHLFLFVLLPMWFFPPMAVVAVYVARLALIGTGLFAVLAPGHYPADAACLAAGQRDAGDYFFRQGVATVNFRTGFIGRFLCSGLEYQIEHHFFPNVSPVHYRAMSPLVREFCRESGIPYRTLGWGEAIRASWQTFFQPKPVERDIERLRTSQESHPASGEGASPQDEAGRVPSPLNRLTD